MTRTMRGVCGAVLLLGVLGLPMVALGQSDLTVQSFNCPGGNTRCFRVHANTTSASVTLNGDVVAAGGYKVAYVFAHPNYMRVNSSNVQAPIAGAGPATINAVGPLYHRPGVAGTFVGVSIVSNTALTGTGAAHAEAIRFDGTTAVATGLTAVIGAGLTNTQYAATTQARGLDIFTASEGVGCRMTVDSAATPTNAILACTVIVAY